MAEYTDPPTLPETDEGTPPPSDGPFQPLPDFDNVVVPETQPYLCARCGQTHQAVLVGQAPLGDMKIMLQYRAVDCPVPAFDVVDGGPVVREAHDG